MSNFQPPPDYLRREQEAIDMIDDDTKTESQMAFERAGERVAAMSRELRENPPIDWRALAEYWEKATEKHCNDWLRVLDQRDEARKAEADILKWAGQLANFLGIEDPPQERDVLLMRVEDGIQGVVIELAAIKGRREWGRKHYDGTISINTEADAREWARSFPAIYSVVCRYAEGPWVAPEEGK